MEMNLRRQRRREHLACKRIEARHVGGPGQPDCVGPVGEVKDWARTLGPGDVRRIAGSKLYRAHRLRVICAIGAGFTSGARREAVRRGLVLSACGFRARRRG